ncbi:PrgI family protein [Ruminococcaceae bacterium OttesenSCG-928-L11]|nr:PrgI family protein [Ruminococcaceae bacterium OttesenSCG-928-L11]
MPYVQIPKDLGRVRTKVALNLTKRQLICFGCAAAIGIPVYLLTRAPLGTEAAVLLMIGLMLPFFFLAMYEKDGQPAEKVLRNMLRARLWPGKRPYKTDNLYAYLQKGGHDIGQNKATAKAGKASAKQHPAGKKGPRR